MDVGVAAPVLSGSSPEGEDNTMTQWEYKVVYVDFRGRISAEGAEFIRKSGEHRTEFVRRYLDVLGKEGWDLAGIQPLQRLENSYFVMKRPLREAGAA